MIRFSICKLLITGKINFFGEMAEWFKAHAWKACKGAIPSWVRIPFSPPSKKVKFISADLYFYYFFYKDKSAFFLKNVIISCFPNTKK